MTQIGTEFQKYTTCYDMQNGIFFDSSIYCSAHLSTWIHNSYTLACMTTLPIGKEDMNGITRALF